MRSNALLSFHGSAFNIYAVESDMKLKPMDLIAFTWHQQLYMNVPKCFIICKLLILFRAFCSNLAEM